MVAAGSTQGEIMLWSVETQKPVSEPLYHTSGEQSASVALPEIKIALSPDQKTLASGGVDGEIVLWDLATGKPRREPLPIRAGTVNHLEFSRDGHTLVSANNDGAVILWAIDQQLGNSLHNQDHRIWSLTFNPIATNQPQLISGSEEGKIIFWDIASGQPVGQPLIGHTMNVNSVEVSPVNTKSATGRILASGSDDQTVRLWNLSAGELLAEPLIGHTDSVLDVTFSPDGQILASAGRDGSIILWDMSTFQPLGQPLTGHTDGVWEVAFSSDGKILASASWDGSIILWDMATKEPLGPPLIGHQGAVISVAASPTMPILASAGRDGAIILWDLNTGQPVSSPLQGYPGSVWRVAFSPDGQTLASAGCAQVTARGNCEQGEIRLWDVATGRQLGQSFVGHSDVAWTVAFNPDGDKLASSSRDGTIILWDLSRESWMKRACDIANRNLSEAEWQQYLGDEPYRETCDLSEVETVISNQ
jgi:WD40 repeat protein